MGYGDKMQIGSYTLICRSYTQDDTPNKGMEWAVMDVYRGDTKIDTMTPVREFYKASQQASTKPDMGIGWDLQVITMVVLGGVNIFGGSGTMPGVILAILVMSTMTFGLSLHNVAGIEQNIIVGALLIAVVAAPLVARKLAARRRRP